ncbi:MAG: MFS transporter, partial [Thermomicrobiaceae bacterium]|nr:MFS transporter [Thermomicrobiaceae bacterium]
YLYQIAVMWVAVQAVGSEAGLVAAAGAAASLACGLLGGVYADRWDRRRTMIAADLIRAAAVGALPLLARAGRLDLAALVAVSIVVGALTSLFTPALQASLPTLAGDARTLQAVNGLMDATRRLARAIGPSLTGALLALMPLPDLFTLDAVSFVVSAAAIASLGRSFAWKPVERPRARGLAGIAADLRDAGRVVWRNRPLLWGFVAGAIVALAWSAAFTVGAPLLAGRVLGGGPGAYGLLVGAYGVGNVLSNLVVGSLAIRRRVAVMFAGRAVVGLGFVLLAAAPNLPLALAASALAAVGGPMGDIMQLLLIQTEVPDEQVGKVFSLEMTGESVGVALGLVLAGPLFGALSVPLAIGCCALVMVATGLAGLVRFGIGAPAPPEVALALETPGD